MKSREHSSSVILIIVNLVYLVQTTKVHFVHWNTSNPIFRIDNTDHIVDVNSGNLAFEYDQANIICPFYNPRDSSNSQERFVVYNVSREEYETCRITNPNPRVIAVCDTPNQMRYVTITFRSFTPTPGGMEFKPGKDYYFISTSSKTDLHRRVGGWCTTHNMKMVFKVSQNEPISQQETKSEEGHQVNLDPIDLYYPADDEVTLVESNDLDNLKRSDRDYLDESVIKQEASRMQQDEGGVQQRTYAISAGGVPKTGSGLVVSLTIVMKMLF